MRVVRVLGVLEPGGAQLSALLLSAALRRHGVATTLLAGDATPSGLALAARYGFPADAFRVSEVVNPRSLQWTPEPGFSDLLAPGPGWGRGARRRRLRSGSRAARAPDVLGEARALRDVPPPAYLVGDGPMRQALVRLVRARGLQTVVRLPGWSYEPSRYVSGASVHAVPSRQESWAQSAVVALGLGVPVIGTPVDGLARTLGAGRRTLIPSDDPHAPAAALPRA